MSAKKLTPMQEFFKHTAIKDGIVYPPSIIEKFLQIEKHYHKEQLKKDMPNDEEIRIMAEKKALQTEDEMFFIAFQYGAKWLKQLLNK